MAPTPYPSLSSPVASQALLDLGPSIFDPFNPVLTHEVDTLVDLSDEETDRLVQAKDAHVAHGLSDHGLYYAALGAVHDLPTTRIDHLDPWLIDPLVGHGNPGLSPHYREFNTYLVGPKHTVWCVSAEQVAVPATWSGTAILHPDYASVGLTASPLILPPGFVGRIGLLVHNHNPTLAVRLHRGHGIVCLGFVAHGHPAAAPFDADALLVR